MSVVLSSCFPTSVQMERQLQTYNNVMFIMPSDTDDLTAVPAELFLIFAPGTTDGQLRITTVGGQDVTFPIAVAGRFAWPIKVQRVWATGTSPELTFLGFH